MLTFFLFFKKPYAFLDTTPIWIHLYYMCVLTGEMEIMMAARELASVD